MPSTRDLLKRIIETIGLSRNFCALCRNFGQSGASNPWFRGRTRWVGPGIWQWSLVGDVLGMRHFSSNGTRSSSTSPQMGGVSVLECAELIAHWVLASAYWPSSEGLLTCMCSHACTFWKHVIAHSAHLYFRFFSAASYLTWSTFWPRLKLISSQPNPILGLMHGLDLHMHRGNITFEIVRLQSRPLTL